MPPLISRYITGYVIENLETFIIESALFDSGASSDNYISEAFVNKYINMFKPHIIQHNSTVRLGDSTTTVNLTHIITLNISFLDNNSITHEAVINFSIMKMSLDMIIGINSILFSFYDLFLDMLKTARAFQLTRLNHNIPSSKSSNFNPDPSSIHTLNTLSRPSYPAISNDISCDNPHYENCTSTWSYDIEHISPEELEIPDPCSFSAPLLTLDVDKSTVLDTYYALLLTNINPEFVNACPEVMRSDIALSVFCPEGWQDILGIDPLVLEVSPLCPTRSFNRPRPLLFACSTFTDKSLSVPRTPSLRATAQTGQKPFIEIIDYRLQIDK
jgi:hypothetical protein